MDLPHRQQILDLLQMLTTHHLQGKGRSLHRALLGLLGGGHLLIEDLPGVGKTTLALSLARVLGLDFGRIQCTSDLLPSDMTGLSIFDREQSRFHFVEGPIFNHLVLVDEINRALPKTQSALLEAMEEQRVTVEGVTYSLPDPFMVIATQNPQDQVGTFPLPESQLDRFLLTTGIGYPPAEVEKSIIRTGSIRDQLTTLTPQIDAAQLVAAKHFVANEIQLHDRVINYLHAILEESRKSPYFINGISTRGGLSLAAAAKAEAYLAGRLFVVPDDVQRIAVEVTAHRLQLRADQEHRRKDEVMRSLLADIPVPIA